jgi:DNA-binding CsgD family transcriptional regulator
MTRLIFLPSENAVFLLEEETPADVLVQAINAGRWSLPEPYTTWVAAVRNKTTPLIAAKFGSFVILSLRESLPEPPQAWLPGLVLSKRQRQVLQGLSEGLTTQQIGARLGLQARTIGFHINGLKKRLGAVSRSQVVGKAVSLGMVQRVRRH